MTWKGLTVAAILSVLSGASAAAEFGPLPSIDVDAAQAALGERLFHDRRLSGDAALSCATCHQPDHGFANPDPLSRAYAGSGGFRNAPGLVASAHKRVWFHDGRIGTGLADAARECLTMSWTMNMDLRLMRERLAQDPAVVEAFAEAGHPEPTAAAVLGAIAAFLKTLAPRDAPFDTGTISPAARRGFALFEGKARCALCHSGPLFSDQRPRNLGVPENPALWAEPMRHHALVAFATTQGLSNPLALRRDPGTRVRTRRADGKDFGAFVTPSLRELAHTPPYMHNGVFETLAAVVDFYDLGGGEDWNKDALLRPLGLSAAEKQDLLAFLETLSGSWRSAAAAGPPVATYDVLPFDPAPASEAPPGGIPDPDPDPPLAALGAAPIPADNPQTEAKVALGRMLFFDPRLGGDASMACSTCHDPKQGWAFSDDLSRGYPGTVHWRNSQTVINTAHYDRLFWAGSARTLEEQARMAARSAVAGNGEHDVMEARLAFVPAYRAAFEDVFGTARPLIDDAWRAIAAFERTLVQTDTPIDRYLRGEKDALSPAQLKGKALFEGKAGCIECHNGALAADGKYYNLGVPRAERWSRDGLAQVTLRYQQVAKGVPQALYRSIRDDAGLFYRTKREGDMGRFRTPSLRYTKYTAPYMHNGAFWDLAEVVDFYDRGGGANEFPTKTRILKPLGLTASEKSDLVAFVEAFSGDEILMDPPKLPDYGGLDER